VLEDGARIGQSIAILEYLEERWPTPRLLPTTPVARARARQLAEMINSGIQPLQNTSVQDEVKALGADPNAWVQRWVGRGLDALESTVRETAGRFAVGDEVTIADLCIVPQLGFARRFKMDLSRCPTLLKIDQACAEIEAFRKAAPDQQPDAPAQG
jgi:maleylpyruvate isomerase